MLTIRSQLTLLNDYYSGTIHIINSRMTISKITQKSRENCRFLGYNYLTKSLLHKMQKLKEVFNISVESEFFIT